LFQLKKVFLLFFFVRSNTFLKKQLVRALKNKSNAYTMVLHKHGDFLYNGVKQTVQEHLQAVALVLSTQYARPPRNPLEESLINLVTHCHVFA
jgi:hypothetical protein